MMWLVKKMLDFVVRHDRKVRESQFKVVYYYKDCNVHEVIFSAGSEHINWMRTAMISTPLDPPENWDRWRIQQINENYDD